MSPIETGDVKHELDPAVGGEAKMPDFHGRAHERDISFEEHAEQMLTLSADHDEEIRSIKEEMLAEQDALLAENQRLQRAVADNEATKLSGSDLRSREREVHNTESRRDEYALKPLSESETRTIRFVVEPKSVRLIFERLLSFFAVRNKRAFEIVSFSDAEWEEIQRDAAAAEKYDPHNKWLAFTLKQLFDRPSDFTDAFEALVIGTAPVSQQIDGRWIFKRMQKPIVALSSKETRAQHDAFNTDTYLTPGASAVHVLSSIALLRSDFEALPLLYTEQPNALVHALLLHFARVCPLKAEELDNELAVDEAGGYPFKHTLEQLVALIATFTSKAKAIEVSVIEDDKGRGRDRPGRDRDRVSTGAARECTNCGNCPEGGPPNHHPKDCLYKAVCFGVGSGAKPGLKGCPCGQKHATEKKVRGITACCLKWSTCPANNVYTRDGPNKKLLVGYMQGWYIRDWKLMNEKPSASVPTVSVIEGNHNGLLFGNRFAENYSGAEFSVIERVECVPCVEVDDPDGSWVDGAEQVTEATVPTPSVKEMCAQCEANGDPTGELIKDFDKCYGGNSQCERKCVCKDARLAGLTMCEGCNNKYCSAHWRGRDPETLRVHGWPTHVCNKVASPRDMSYTACKGCFVCKKVASPCDMSYTTCKGCLLSFCPVHWKAFDNHKHGCPTPLNAYPPLNAYVYEANLVESTASGDVRFTDFIVVTFEAEWPRPTTLRQISSRARSKCGTPST